MNKIADAVYAITLDSLFNDDELIGDEPPPGAVKVEGIVAHLFAFHPQRLASHREEIAALCRLMPDNFHQRSAGGWSFLNLCETKDGEQWGQHRDCEMLVALAIGTGQGGYCLPREFWADLPGGVPYVFFDVEPIV